MPEIRSCREDEIDALADYASTIYPYRCKTEKDRIRYRKLARFWFLRTPDTYRYMVLMKVQGKIIGQAYGMPADYYWNGMRHEAAWAFDLFVDAGWRQDTYGVDIMLEHSSQLGDSFNTGANDTSLAMQRLMKNMQIGSLRKYVGCGTLLGLWRVFYPHAIPASAFPVSVKSGHTFFEKCPDAGVIATDKAFNPDLLEWGRGRDFVCWYYGPRNVNEYVLYKDRESRNYFVVRPIRHAHAPMLALVDFRCPLECGEIFREMVRAVRKIARRLYIPFIVSSSTLAVTDRVLETAWFRSVGRPRPVMSKKKWKGMEDRIAGRTFLQVNFVDSDGEAGWE